MDLKDLPIMLRNPWLGSVAELSGNEFGRMWNQVRWAEPKE